MAGNYALLALSFGISVYLTRTLGADGFGRLMLMIAIGQTATVFAAFWTQAAFLRHGAEELATDGTLRKVFWGRALVVGPTVIAFIALGWLVRDWIAAFHGVAEIGYGLLAAYVVTMVVSQSFQVVYQARGRAGFFAFLQAGERALILGTLLAAHTLATPAPANVLGIYIAASAAATPAAM